MKTVNELGRDARRALRLEGRRRHAARLRRRRLPERDGHHEPRLPRPSAAPALATSPSSASCSTPPTTRRIRHDDGRADVDKFADFMRMLDPPPRSAQNADAQAGQHALHPDRLRGLPRREHHHGRRTPPRSSRRPPAARGDQREPQRHPRQPDVPSLLATSCCTTWDRSATASRRAPRDRADAHAAAVGRARQVAVAARRACREPSRTRSASTTGRAPRRATRSTR